MMELEFGQNIANMAKAAVNLYESNNCSLSFDTIDISIFFKKDILTFELNKDGDISTYNNIADLPDSLIGNMVFTIINTYNYLYKVNYLKPEYKLISNIETAMANIINIYYDTLLLQSNFFKKENTKVSMKGLL